MRESGKKKDEGEGLREGGGRERDARPCKHLIQTSSTGGGGGGGGGGGSIAMSHRRRAALHLM